MTQEPTSVFVRLPLSNKQIGKFIALVGTLNSRIGAIGTPVAGGDMQVFDIVDAAYGDTNEKYVRQSDAQAQLAARDAEIARLRDVIHKMTRLGKAALKGGAP